jgi:uncharacterized protein (TIGR03382 family)
MQPLDPANPTAGVSPLASNADGTMVVGEFNVNSSEEGFLWTPTLGIQRLETYLPTLGVDLTGWSIGTATGVSADGQTIVGKGSYNGVARGWIVTIPAPASLAVAGFGLLALSRRRRG